MIQLITKWVIYLSTLLEVVLNFDTLYQNKYENYIKEETNFAEHYKKNWAKEYVYNKTINELGNWTIS